MLDDLVHATITNSADECLSASNKTSSERVKVITKELESQHMVGDRLGFRSQVPLLAWVDGSW